MEEPQRGVSQLPLLTLVRLADRSGSADKRPFIFTKSEQAAPKNCFPLPLFEPLPSLGLDQQQAESSRRPVTQIWVGQYNRKQQRQRGSKSGKSWEN